MSEPTEEIQESVYEDNLDLSDVSVDSDHSDSSDITGIMASCIQPPRFCGDSGARAEIWLRHYENYAHLTKLCGEARLMMLPFFPDGKAKKWYDALPLDTQGNYARLKTELTKRFNGDDGLSQGLGLWALRKLPGESLDDYFLRVQSFSRDNVPEQFLVSVAIPGLTPELKQIVMPQPNVKTLEDLRIATTLAERTLLATGASVSAMEPGPQFMKLLMDQIKDLTMAIKTHNQPQEKSQDRPETRQRRQRVACRNCRGMVSHKLEKRPAYNLKCEYCGGKHHTEAVCEKKARECSSSRQ